MVRLKGPAKSRVHTQQPEIVGRNGIHPDPLGAVVPLPIRCERKLAARQHVAEDVRQAAVIAVVGERHPVWNFRVLVPCRQDHQLTGVPHRQRPQQEGVDHAVNRGVEADAKPQSHDRDAGQAQVLSQ